MGSQPELKIKLVAIAKDEAAYLPEWIFHHLYFGFDAIDIYVNNTTDNTHELSLYLAPLESVSFIDGDSYFLSGLKTPQQNVYSSAFTKAKEQGFSHIMFLDIDEFWTPLDMSTSIKDCLNLLRADVISFEWLNKFEDNKFSPALESEISGEHHRLVKTLMSLNLNSEKLDIHNIEVEGAINVLADGTKPIFSDGNQQLSKVGEIKPYLIIHRMYRSSLEYALF
ncbi:glycosyltransferase family 2 protein [Pseudoalteromonas sp. Hal099]